MLSRFIRKGLDDSSDKWNPAFICYFFVLQNGVPVFCNNLINCRLHSMDFIASITQMRFKHFALVFKDFIKRTDSSNSGC